MINLVRGLLVLGWLVIAWFTWRAISEMGAGVAGDIFFADLAHPWRGQFNADFLLHLVLVALWLGWTAQRKMLAPLVALLAVIGGGCFTLAYLLIRSFGGDQSIAHLLLGRQYHNKGSGR
jgi:hypothetical protein